MDFTFPNLASINVNVYGREYDGGTLAFVTWHELYAALHQRGLLERFHAAFRRGDESLLDLPARDVELALARMLSRG